MRAFLTKRLSAFGQLLAVVIVLCVAVAPLAAIAQTPPAAMTPGRDEYVGELKRGELLVTALKREKIDGNSVRMATQSLGELLDFRLSRSGDKYLYRLTGKRQLALLRYQRGQHIYESVLTEDGRYVSRLIDTNENSQRQREVYIHPPQTEDEDGEIDVERVVMAPDLQAQRVGHGAGDSIGHLGRLEGEEAEFGDPEAPPQPVDPALRGRLNPDDDYPQGPYAATGYDEDEEQDDTWEARGFPFPGGHAGTTARNTQDDPTQPAMPVFKVAAPKQDREPDGLSCMSIAIAGLGFLAFFAAILVTLFPAWRARRRMSANGLHIQSDIAISWDQRLACVAVGDHRFLIAIQPQTTTLIAPCGDDQDLLRKWQHLKRKAYWHQMAQKPIPQTQLATILDDLIEAEHMGQDDTLINQAPAAQAQSDATPTKCGDVAYKAGAFFDIEDIEAAMSRSALEQPEPK
ncbi:MAG: hypothetical protein FWC40_06105 [Proteobacteria bacterium]|nr:hypothetical protein [Pseudomonadota bacterium]